MFDGLSLSGDEAWSRGLNLWPLTLCLKSLPGLFGDEDLVQDWSVSRRGNLTAVDSLSSNTQDQHAAK